MARQKDISQLLQIRRHQLAAVSGMILENLSWKSDPQTPSTAARFENLCQKGMICSMWICFSLSPSPLALHTGCSSAAETALTRWAPAAEMLRWCTGCR